MCSDPGYLTTHRQARCREQPQRHKQERLELGTNDCACINIRTEMCARTITEPYTTTADTHIQSHTREERKVERALMG